MSQGFQPPDAIEGFHLKYMIYRPHFSKKRGCWVPGAFPNQMGCAVQTWDEFCAGIERTPDIVDEKGKITSISPGVLTRGSEKREAKSVESIWFLAIDLDQGRDDLEFVWKRVHELGVAAIFHTTWSHTHPGKGERWRVYIQLAEPVPAKQWRQFWRAAMLMFCGGADARLKADRSCVNEDRVYYAPAVAPGYEHTYQHHRVDGAPLPLEEVWESIGKQGDPLQAQSGDRLATIAAHRAMMAPMARRLSREDLETLAKDKKKVSDPAMRAAFKAVANGERMLVVKGESRGDVLTQANKSGLYEGDVDPFLTQLMYRLAIHHRNVDPLEVDRVFSASMSILIDDDQLAGNTPYEPSALGRKFVTAVTKIDEEEVEKATKLGVPTKAEFSFTHGLDEGTRVDGELPGRIWPGHNCFFIFRQGADGELTPQPISNFGIVPREIWLSEDFDDNGARALKYVVDLVGDEASYGHVEMPSEAITSAKAFTDFLKPYHPFVWKGATDDQTRDVRLRIEEYAREHGGIRRYISTHKLGVRVEDQTVVAPQMTFKNDGGVGVMEVEDGVRFERNNSFTWNRGVYDCLTKRRPEIDVNTMRHFASLLVQLNDPRVMWPTLGWFAASALRPFIIKAQGSFPHLQLVGSQGSGKSFLASKLSVDAYGGHEVSVQNMPFYTAARECAGITSFPTFFDEFRDDVKTARLRAKDIRSLLRSDYNDTRVTRASLTDLILTAPIVIAGEQRVFGEGGDYDRAVAERMIVVRPKLTYTHTHKAEDPIRAQQYKAAFDEINTLAIESSGMWAAFPAWAVAHWGDVNKVRDWLRAADGWTTPVIRQWRHSASSRVYENLRVVWFGAWIWQAWCRALGVNVAVPHPAIACESTLEEVCGTGATDTDESLHQVSDPVAAVLEDVSMLLSAQGFQASLSTSHFWLREGDDLWIDVPMLINFYRSQSESMVVNSERQLYQYAEESDLVIKKGGTGSQSVKYRKHIPGSQRAHSRCIKLSVERLEAAGVALANVFLKDSGQSAPEPHLRVV